MKKITSFMMAAFIALSLSACQNTAETDESKSSLESSLVNIEDEISVSDPQENGENTDSKTQDTSEPQQIKGGNELIIPSAYKGELRSKKEEFPVSKYLDVKAEDVESFSIFVLENGSEKELILEDDDAQKAADYLLKFPIYHNNYNSVEKRDMGEVVFLLRSKGGRVDTFCDDGLISINEQNKDFLFTKLEDLKLPLPDGAKFKSYKLDLATGEKKAAYNFNDPLIKYLVDNIDPALYRSIYMEGKDVCILAKDENMEEIKQVVAAYGDLGGRMVLYNNYVGKLSEHYSLRKHLEAKIEALGLKDKLRVILKRGYVEVLGSANDDLTAFLDWIKTYGGRGSVYIKLS